MSPIFGNVTSKLQSDSKQNYWKSLKIYKDLYGNDNKAKKLLDASIGDLQPC